MNDPLKRTLALIILTVLLVGCGPSQEELDATSTKIAADVFATQTAEAPPPTDTPLPTDTPTPLPTDTPTAAPVEPSEVALDFSSMELVESDLPPGFDELPVEELGLTAESMSTEDFTIQALFAFWQLDPFEMVMGFLQQLSMIDQFGFDIAVQNSEELLDAFLEGLGAETVQERKELPPLEGVGDSSAGFTVVTDVEGIGIMRIDFMILRRENVGAYVFIMYLEENAPSIEIGEIAAVLDQRILKALPEASD
ncbi:MAG: hypothetical protein GTO14_15445 [Anaerolineales bacterium]|nr:hypothetical protein [Anaerolineales bacterium]